MKKSTVSTLKRELLDNRINSKGGSQLTENMRIGRMDRLQAHCNSSADMSEAAKAKLQAFINQERGKTALLVQTAAEGSATRKHVTCEVQAQGRAVINEIHHLRADLGLSPHIDKEVLGLLSSQLRGLPTSLWHGAREAEGRFNNLASLTYLPTLCLPGLMSRGSWLSLRLA